MSQSHYYDASGHLDNTGSGWGHAYGCGSTGAEGLGQENPDNSAFGCGDVRSAGSGQAEEPHDPGRADGRGHTNSVGNG